MQEADVAKRLIRFAGSLLIVAAGLGAAFLWAMRTKNKPVQDAVRRFNREVMNPAQMESAGQPGAYASVMRHVGRTSGTKYETPVQALPTEDGFIIPLPYGTSPDWLKNVMAAESATIAHEGSVFAVDKPTIVPATAAERYVPAKERRTHRWFGVDEFLRVHRTDVHEAQQMPASA